EIVARREFIMRTIATEEENFNRTLTRGLDRFEQMMSGLSESEQTLPGEEAFRLYDTYGLPRDLIEELAKERGLAFDQVGFDQAMQRQQGASRASGMFRAVVGEG